MANMTTYGRTTAGEALDGSLYAALHDGDPGVTGASNELSGDSYARAAVTMSMTGNVMSNGVINWSAVTATKSGVGWISIWDAVSGGNCHFRGPITSFDWEAGNPVQCPADNITITFT